MPVMIDLTPVTPPDEPQTNKPHLFHKLSRRRFLALAGGSLAYALQLATGKAQAASSNVGQRRASSDEATLDYKIAQMLMIGFTGGYLSPTNPVVRDIRDRGVGGVYLIDYSTPATAAYSNVRSPAQLAALTAGLRSLAKGWPLPLLVGTDQEGGQVARLKTKYGFPPSVTQQYLGALNNLATTHRYALTTARALAAGGLNLNLAPVVDLNTNPANPVIGRLGRSFSADPVIVANHALEVIKAHHEQGVVCTLKHFPGHGSSRSDSHLGFVDVTGTWSRTELQPYAKIIAAGQADLIMTAHIFNANLDPDLPATLSNRTVAGILRGQLGYNGVVISDDMQMKAISGRYTLEQALRLSINAGVDMITLSPTRVYQPDLASRPIAIIKGLVQSGAISEERIEQSYGRIKALKGRIGS